MFWSSPSNCITSQPQKICWKSQMSETTRESTSVTRLLNTTCKLQESVERSCLSIAPSSSGILRLDLVNPNLSFYFKYMYGKFLVICKHTLFERKRRNLNLETSSTAKGPFGNLCVFAFRLQMTWRFFWWIVAKIFEKESQHLAN